MANSPPEELDEYLLRKQREAFGMTTEVIA